MNILFATLIGTALIADIATNGCSPSVPAAADQGTGVCAQEIAPTEINQTEDSMQPQHSETANDPHPYVGMWVTADGRIRQELLPNGRYDEARGARESAYVGRYEITGTTIYYWDDSGFTADGEFVDMNTLHHAGMIMYREAPRQ